MYQNIRIGGFYFIPFYPKYSVPYSWDRYITGQIDRKRKMSYATVAVHSLATGAVTF
jgi:uncharacterized Rossmann fold enzyme